MTASVSVNRGDRLVVFLDGTASDADHLRKFLATELPGVTVVVVASGAINGIVAYRNARR